MGFQKSTRSNQDEVDFELQHSGVVLLVQTMRFLLKMSEQESRGLLMYN